MNLSRGQGCLVKLLVAAVVVWGIYKFFFPTYVWHEDIALTVVTPDGEKYGSSIRRIKVVKTPALLPQMTGAENSVKGEAVVVNLGEDRYLFSLLGAPVGWAPVVYQAQHPDARRGAIHRWESSLRDKGALPIPGHGLPLLVTFDDINDPASVKRVDPFDMDATFGLCPDGSGLSNEDAPWRAEKMLWREWALYKGTGMSLEEFRSSGNYHGFSIPELQQRKAAIVPRDTSNDCHRLQSITLEITNEPVTEGKVEAVLGREFFKEFAKRFKAGLNSSDFDNSKLFYQLSRGAFIKE